MSINISGFVEHKIIGNFYVDIVNRKFLENDKITMEKHVVIKKKNEIELTIYKNDIADLEKIISIITKD